MFGVDCLSTGSGTLVYSSLDWARGEWRSAWRELLLWPRQGRARRGGLIGVVDCEVGHVMNRLAERVMVVGLRGRVSARWFRRASVAFVCSEWFRILRMDSEVPATKT